MGPRTPLGVLFRQFYLGLDWKTKFKNACLHLSRGCKKSTWRISKLCKLEYTNGAWWWFIHVQVLSKVYAWSRIVKVATSRYLARHVCEHEVFAMLFKSVQKSPFASDFSSWVAWARFRSQEKRFKVTRESASASANSFGRHLDHNQPLSPRISLSFMGPKSAKRWGNSTLNKRNSNDS